MTQEQKKVSNQGVSNKSFDDILERMRSRVSEISDQGRVRNILNEDQVGSSSVGEAVDEHEQNRNFLEMSQKIAAEEGLSQEKQPLEVNSTSSLQGDPENLSAGGPSLEMPEDIEAEKENENSYNQILEALQMKDLSSLRSADPSELDEIINSVPESKGTKEEGLDNETTIQSSAETEEAVVSDVVGDTPTSEMISNEDTTKTVVEENTSIDQLQDEETTLAVSEDREVVSEETSSPEMKKKDYASAFERLTKVATSMGRSLDEKNPKSEEQSQTIDFVAEDEVSKTEVEAIVAAVDGEKSLDLAEASQADVSEVQNGISKMVKADDRQAEKAEQEISEERHAAHNQRLDQLEKTLEKLSLSQVEMEKRSVDLFEKQENALRVITRESQKVSEATATRLSEKLSLEVEKKGKEEQMLLRADMETVQSGLKELTQKFEGSSQQQIDVYEMMQTSLAALHDKMNSLSLEQEKMAVAPVAVMPQVQEQSLSARIQKELGAPEMAVQAQAVPADEDGNMSLSAQVLKNFVNAPLVQHPHEKEQRSSTLFGDGQSAFDDGEQVERRAGSLPMRPVTNARESRGVETSMVAEPKKSSKAPALLAITSMFMFSVSGFLFYDHLKKQGFRTEMSSVEKVEERTIADLGAPTTTAGLVGKKKIVEWRYNGRKKENIARLSTDDKLSKEASSAGYVDITSNTEIIEVTSARDSVPLTTSSIGGRLPVVAVDTKRKGYGTKRAGFKKPSVLIGSSSLRYAAGKGTTSAMFEVARRYQNGKGVKKNYKEAVKWYRRAAQNDYAPAQYRLGTLYERGRGVEKDIESARDWYRRSAKLGNVKAMHNLGVIYSGQKELRPDYGLAIEWFTKAARHGLADSQFNLAIINYNGLGKKKDITEAYKWFALASKNGDKAAKDQQENIAKKMKIKQVMDGRKKASAWKTKAIPVKANIDLSKKYAWQDYAEL